MCTHQMFTVHPTIHLSIKSGTVTAHPLNTHGYSNLVCLRRELWLYGWPNLGNAQVRLPLAALVCTNGGPTVTIF